MKKYLKNLIIKVIKTAAETALGVIGATALITGVDWMVVGSAVLMSAVVTVLFNLAHLEDKDAED